jgi:phosphoribosylformylglycinamidine synthase
MPHPERFIYREQHYDRDWQHAEHGWGYYLFQSIYQTVTA